MLSITDLAANYGSSQALFGMSLQLNEGEVVTLLGRNGMGKTTTLLSVMGIIPAIGGQITGGQITYKQSSITGFTSVSYTHLTLPTIYSV